LTARLHFRMAGIDHFVGFTEWSASQHHEGEPYFGCWTCRRYFRTDAKKPATP
jgi:hypothetical protein